MGGLDILLVACEMGYVTCINVRMGTWENRRDEQLVHQFSCQDVTSRKEIFPKRLM